MLCSAVVLNDVNYGLFNDCDIPDCKYPRLDQTLGSSFNRVRYLLIQSYVLYIVYVHTNAPLCHVQSGYQSVFHLRIKDTLCCAVSEQLIPGIRY